MTEALDIEVVGLGGPILPLEEIERLLELSLGSAGIESGHVAVEFVSPERIAELNFAPRAVPPMSCRSRSTAPTRSPARASSATSSSARSTPPTCARRSSTGRCT
jgi:hypothetical protein